jgi:hypothetical protein
MVRVYSEATKKKMQEEQDKIHKVCPCPCGFVPKASECGIYSRWKKGTFGLKGSGCMPLDFHRAYLYRKEQEKKGKR